MQKKISVQSLLKIIVLYICYTKIGTNISLTNVPNKYSENLIEKNTFKYQHKLLEKKIKCDLKYKKTTNTNEKLTLYLDIEGKWVGYNTHKYCKNRVNELRLLIKDNQRILNTTLFGIVTFY